MKVKIYTAAGTKALPEKHPFVSNASTWGELERELINEGISFNNIAPIHGESNVQFLKNSVLPEEFTLFLMPDKKVKSGVSNVQIVALLNDAVENITQVIDVLNNKSDSDVDPEVEGMLSKVKDSLNYSLHTSDEYDDEEDYDEEF